MSSKSFLLRSRRIVTPEGVKEGELWIQEGKIRQIFPLNQGTLDVQVEDVGNLVVMPGLVDSHVHVNEPGRTEWEGFETATHAAAAGGITTLADMPLNCIPVTTTLKAFQIKLEECRSKLQMDCAFWGGVVPGNLQELEPMMDAGISGFKAFLIHSGIDDFPQASEADLRASMPLIAKRKLPLLVHAELDGSEESASDPTKNVSNYWEYLASRPKKWEMDAIALMIQLCRETSCPVHIVHLSCADALPMIQSARLEGLPFTVETCSHYLTLAAENVAEGDTRFKCAPPIREQENANRLWKGLEEGVIDFIVSDHSPCTPALKLMEKGDFQGAWGGISSLQFGLSVIWTEAKRRGYSLLQLAQWMCEKPATLLHLAHKKGKIAQGYDADLIVWNPEATIQIQPETTYHRHKVTPYEGQQLFGKIEQTLLRGQRIYNQGVFSTPVGQCILSVSSAGVH